MASTGSSSEPRPSEASSFLDASATKPDIAISVFGNLVFNTETRRPFVCTSMGSVHTDHQICPVDCVDLPESRFLNHPEFIDQITLTEAEMAGITTQTGHGYDGAKSKIKPYLTFVTHKHLDRIRAPGGEGCNSKSDSGQHIVALVSRCTMDGKLSPADLFNDFNTRSPKKHAAVGVLTNESNEMMTTLLAYWRAPVIISSEGNVREEKDRI